MLLIKLTWKGISRQQMQVEKRIKIATSNSSRWILLASPLWLPWATFPLPEMQSSIMNMHKLGETPKHMINRMHIIFSEVNRNKYFINIISYYFFSIK